MTYIGTQRLRFIGQTLKAATLTLSFAIAAPVSSYAQVLFVENIRLGVSFEEAETILTESGYVATPYRGRPSYKSLAPTFEQNVDHLDPINIPYSAPKGIKSVSYARGENAQEWMILNFTELPGGAYVTDITYKPLEGAFTEQEFNVKINTEFGEPDSTEPPLKIWSPDNTLVIDDIEFIERLDLFTQGDLRLRIVGKMKTEDYGAMVVDAHEKRLSKKSTD